MPRITEFARKNVRAPNARGSVFSRLRLACGCDQWRVASCRSNGRQPPSHVRQSRSARPSAIAPASQGLLPAGAQWTAPQTAAHRTVCRRRRSRSHGPRRAAPRLPNGRDQAAELASSVNLLRSFALVGGPVADVSRGHHPSFLPAAATTFASVDR